MLTIPTQTPKKIFNKENEFARALKKANKKGLKLVLYKIQSLLII